MNRLMRNISILKTILLISYSLIFFNGPMISIPMFLYLLFSIANFDSPLQALTSILAIVGLIVVIKLNFVSNNKKRFLLSVLAFFLLLSPIIQRLAFVPIRLFNYPLFIIPVLLFLISYVLLLIFIFKSTFSKVNN